MPAALRLTGLAGPVGVAQAHAALAGWLPADVAARPRHAIDLVVEEVLMNVAMHGGGGGVALEAVAAPAGRLTLVFEDTGPAFDPTAAAAPPTPGTLAEARVGGLGLGLVRRVATALRYTRSAGANRLEVDLALR